MFYLGLNFMLVSLGTQAVKPTRNLFQKT